jgi:hypothetical protein
MARGDYRSPEAFRTALEQRIRRVARGGNISRFRQLLVFDRFLARVFRYYGERAALKGGLVLELRLARARTTRDVDLWLTGDGANLAEELRAAGALALGDWLSFEISADLRLPRIVSPGMKHDGFRFRAEARLASKLYGEPFGVDVGFADAVTTAMDVTQGSSFLEFAGVEQPTFRIYPRTAHIAEKLHAYTMPRPSPNTRVKDLPDLALLASIGPLVAAEARDAIKATFGYRGTHDIPRFLPRPVDSWAQPYERMALQDELPWRTLAAVHGAAASFLDPLLAGAGGVWDHHGWNWR